MLLEQHYTFPLCTASWPPGSHQTSRDCQTELGPLQLVSAAFEWRNKNGWCQEARISPLELIETCYADEQCCQKSSQCSDGCCGKDKICHKRCFDEKGISLHAAEISLIEYKLLLERPKCQYLIKNVHDPDLYLVDMIVRLTAFAIQMIIVCTGLVCCIRARGRDQRERK